MNSDKKTQYIIITVVSILLLIVVAIFLYFLLNRNNNNKVNTLSVELNQIYSSDYDLKFMNGYFIGMYEPNNINVIINNKGEEIYTSNNNLYFDNIYLLKDGNTLIYNNRDNNLNVYIFDGKKVSNLYTIKGVTNVKPIICNNSYQEYIVGLVSTNNDDTYIYNVLTGERLDLNDTIIMADNIIKDVYYVRNDKYLVVKNKDNLMGVINYEGKVIIDYKYENIINTYNDLFVAINNKDKYGIISSSEEEIIDFKYKVIDIYPDYLLVVDNNNKMAVYDKNCQKVTGFTLKYDPLLTYDLRSTMNSIKLYSAGGRIFVVNNYMEDINKTEYDLHNLYIISNGKVTKTMTQLGFDIKGIIYIYDKDYNIEIYDTDFNLLFKVKLENVKKIEQITYVSNRNILLQYLDTSDKINSLYYDNTGKEVEFNYGDLVFKNDEYQAYVKNLEDNATLIILDNDNKELRRISGKKIEVFGNYVIVDNSIYEMVRKGS